MRPHFNKTSHIENEGFIDIYGNTESSASTEGIQSNYNMQICYRVPINYERTRYFDENVPSVVYNVCQMYAKVSQIVATYGETKVFFPVIFAKFDVEVEFN